MILYFYAMKAIQNNISVLLVVSFACFISRKGYSQYDSIFYDNYNRTFLLRLPSNFSAENKYPLVVAMHGGSGNAYNIENQSKLSLKADAENFIVVYPEGVKGGILNLRAWNAGWCCGYASTSNVDDVGFINALLDTLIIKYSIDTNRIYATGMSNGGFMSYRLACELSQRFASIAPVAASMSMTTCNPQYPVPVIHFHSYQDTSVPWQGGIGDGISGHYNPPLDSVISAWVSHNSCYPVGDIIVNSTEYTSVKWINGDCNAEVNLYITLDGGHSWPGGNQTPVGDPVSEFVNATDLMWDFFQRFSLQCKLSATSEIKPELNEIFLVPNPANGIFTIKAPDSFDNFEVSVHNNLGNRVNVEKNTIVFDISSFSEGIYFVKIQSPTGTIVKKIIRAN